MSGSGSDYTSYNPAPTGGTDNCSRLVIETQLGSPKPDVVKLLNIGEMLDVGVHTASGMAVVVVFRGSDIVGGVASTQLAILRACLEKGVEYQAEVMAINQGQVRVRIRAREAEL